MRKRYFGSVYRRTRPDGTSLGIYVRWTDALGRRHHARGGDTVPQAEARLRALAEEKAGRRALARGESPGEGETLTELAPRILDSWASHVRPVSLLQRRAELHRWAARLGAVPVASITREQVQDQVRALTAGRGYAASSVRTTVAILSGAFRQLRNLGLRLQNPCRDLDLPRIQEKPRRYLTPAQVRRLYACSAAAVRPIVVLLGETGLRPAEAFALRWGDLAPDLGSVQVSRSKTYRTRLLRLSAAAREQVQALQRKRKGESIEDLVLPLREAAFRRHFARAAARAGLQGLVPYGLRHAFASALVRDARADIPTVGRLLGHSGIKMTHRYAQWAPEDANSQAMEALERSRHARPPVPPAAVRKPRRRRRSSRRT